MGDTHRRHMIQISTVCGYLTQTMLTWSRNSEVSIRAPALQHPRGVAQLKFGKSKGMAMTLAQSRRHLPDHHAPGESPPRGHATRDETSILTMPWMRTFVAPSTVRDLPGCGHGWWRGSSSEEEDYPWHLGFTSRVVQATEFRRGEGLRVAHRVHLPCRLRWMTQGLTKRFVHTFKFRKTNFHFLHILEKQPLGSILVASNLNISKHIL
jgi:hypothetical protein